MKFLKLSYFFTGICLLVFSSCKNKLDINAPYKDIPTIYAVLNPQETLQMIRINKTFLGEGNANVSALNADSVNYPGGELVVTLERTVNGLQAPASTTATPSINHFVITFHDSIIQTNPGAFSTTQRVYVTNDRLFTSGQYTLKVKNLRTDAAPFTARADALDSVNHNVNNNFSYTPFVVPYYPVNVLLYTNTGDPNAYPDYSGQTTNYSIKFFPNEAAMYTAVIRLHFYEYVGGDSIPKYVDYTFGNQYIKDLKTYSSGQLFSFEFKGKAFFDGIGYSLSKMNLDQNISRKMYKMQAFAYSTTQDYSDFLQFSAPSLSIAQEKPLYSNFDNRAALGIFTFRSRHSVYKTMASTFISEFAFNPSTCKYRFLTAAGNLGFCN